MVRVFAGKLGGELGKLYCLVSESWVGGVCSGISYYFGVRTWMVRMLVFLTMFLPAPIPIFSCVAYALLWAFIPSYRTRLSLGSRKRIPGDYEQRCG